MSSAQPREPAPERADAAYVLEALLDTSDDAVFRLDRRGRVQHWNRSAERYVGGDPAAMHGTRAAGLFPPNVRADVDTVLQRVQAGDTVRHHETELLRHDGMPMPVSLSLCPVAGPEGASSGSVLVVRDITEQRLAQAALAEVEARVRDSEALAHVGSWLWDRRTGAVQWSDEFHRIHGLDPAAFDGTVDAHLAAIHPDDQDRVRRALAEAIAAGRAFEDEYRVVHPDGSERTIRARAHPTRDSGGAVVGMRGVGQDLSRARR